MFSCFFSLFIFFSCLYSNSVKMETKPGKIHGFFQLLKWTFTSKVSSPGTMTCFFRKVQIFFANEKAWICSNPQIFCFSFVAMPRVKGEELLFKSLWRLFLVILSNLLMNLLLTYLENKAVQIFNFLSKMS